MIPYSFNERKPTILTRPVNDKLTVTTKGYCIQEGFFMKTDIFGSRRGDCIELDLGKHGILPGDELLVWLEFSEPAGSSVPRS